MGAGWTELEVDLEQTGFRSGGAHGAAIRYAWLQSGVLRIRYTIVRRNFWGEVNEQPTTDRFGAARTGAPNERGNLDAPVFRSEGLRSSCSAASARGSGMTVQVASAQRLVVLMSGPVAGGKSSVARELCRRFGGDLVSTGDLLKARVGEGATRAQLQAIGAELDATTGGLWVVDEARGRIEASHSPVIVLDAVRTPEQVSHLRRAFGSAVRHAHVTAARDICARRFALRARPLDASDDYGAVMADPTEAAVDELADSADIVVDTERLHSRDSFVLVASQLGLLDREHHACVDVLVGGGYGSEGKGNIAFHLAPEYDILVRVGGPNAAHKVYPDNGEPYTHFSLPSGTLACDAELVLGPGAVVEPARLLKEIEDCGVTPDRLSIDPRVMIIEEADQAAEQSLVGAIGSTASGTGSATARRLLRRDDVRLAVDVSELQPYVRSTYDILDAAYAAGKRIMLEGTQGSGLSLFHGHYPFVTSRDTNVAGCLAEAGIPPARVRRTILVVRSYPIRVSGNSGPMSKPIEWEEVERRSGLTGLAEKERTSRTGKVRRVGEQEWDLMRRAAVLNAPTDVALTFADYFEGNDDAWRYEQLTEETLQVIDQIERVTGARVSLISTGFMANRGIIDRRQW